MLEDAFQVDTHMHKKINLFPSQIGLTLVGSPCSVACSVPRPCHLKVDHFSDLCFVLDAAMGRTPCRDIQDAVNAQKMKTKVVPYH